MKKLISMALCLIMVLTLFVGFMTVGASAEGETDNGIVLEKSAVLKDNGKYDITLRSYATGTTTSYSTVEKEGTPLDIVLLVDQSGSMSEDLSKLRTAVKSFVDVVKANGEEYGVTHRIAVVGFADSAPNTTGPDYNNTELFVGATQYTYKNGHADHLTEAFQNVADTSGYNNLLASVDAFAADGATHPEIGMKIVNQVFEANPTNSKRVVIMFTDGEPGNITYNQSVANDAIEKAYDAKNKWNAEIYCVGFSGANTTTGRNFMNRMSSNYPFALNMNSEQVTYVKVYGTAQELFNLNRYGTEYAIKHDSAYAAVYGGDVTDRYELTHYCDNNAGALLSHHDYISDFTDPNNSDRNKKNHPYGSGYFINGDHLILGAHSKEGVDGNIRFPKTNPDDTSVTIHTSSNTTATKTPVQFYEERKINTSKYVMTASNEQGLLDAFENISREISGSTHSTDVSLGLSSYVKDVLGGNFVKNLSSANVTAKVYNGTYNDSTGKYDKGSADTSFDSALKTTVNGDNVTVKNFSYADTFISSGQAGKMLEITIKDVELDISKNPNGIFGTNGTDSGIYDSEDAFVEAYPMPQTIVPEKSVVIDYAAKTTISPDKIGLTSVDSGIGMKAATSKYGAFAKDGNAFTYTPNTTRWDGFDSMYVFGKTNDASVTAVSANANGNVWEKVNVIPANNVYYEDNFVAVSGDIVYSGSWDTVNDGAGAANASDRVHGGGWETVYSKYSGGSAQKADSASDYAEFTFTGTGVDVYSRTNNNTGKVLATLYDMSTGSPVAQKALIVNTISQSGDYYQIPTVYFKDLQHGTYKVKINATNTGDYYIDGIRVYNPLTERTISSNDSVKEAYKNERNANFYRIRDYLIGGRVNDDDDITGIAFIDNAQTVDNIEITSERVEITDYKDYGPKNEVYLSKGQAIVFAPDGGEFYYIGLKGPDGKTEATVSNGTGTTSYNVNGATEQYYKVTPNANGLIMIKNTGDKLLSVTNLRVTDNNDPVASFGRSLSFAAMPRMTLMSYANDFDTLSTVEPEDTDIIEPEDINTPEETDVTEDVNTPEENTNTDTPEDNGSGKNDNSPAAVVDQIVKMVKNLFGGLKKLFKGI